MGLIVVSFIHFNVLNANTISTILHLADIMIEGGEYKQSPLCSHSHLPVVYDK